MNKIYKLVYSKTLNQIVAVSELANHAKKHSLVSPKHDIDNSQADAKGHAAANSKTGLAFAFALGSLFTALPIGAAQAQSRQETTQTGPVATLVEAQSTDATINKFLNYISESGFSAKNPGIVAEGGASVKYQQNVPVVEINAPNKQGVSDNRFSKFSTDTGVVFNNNPDGSVTLKASQLAEKIAGNKKLQRAANTILAQVTGNNKSVIKGVMEILGQKADLLIVNPNGIDLNGLALVNVRDLTFTTAEVGDNNHKRLKVQRGTINVNRDLSTDDIGILRIIAKAVQIKASIAPTNGKLAHTDIIVAGGAQEFDLDNNIAIKTNAKGQQTVAIKGSALGSMYGNKVNFVVTETGAGVDYEGQVVAQDSLEISADGKIKVKNTYSAGTTSLKSKDQVEITNAVRSQNRISVEAKTINAAKALVHASSAIEMVATEGDLEAHEVLGQNIKIAAKKNVKTLEGGRLLAVNLDIFAGDDATFDSKVYAAERLQVTAGQRFNSGNNPAEKLLNIAGVNTKDEAPDHLSTVTFTAHTIAGKAIIEADGNVYAAKKPSENPQEGDFNFDNLTISYDLDKEEAGVTLDGGQFLANNLDLDYHTSRPEDLRPLVKVNAGQFAIKQNTLIDLTAGGREVVLETQEQFDKLNRLLHGLTSHSSEIKATGLNINKEGSIHLDASTTLHLNYFYNAGIFRSTGSLGLMVRDGFNNEGIMYVGGDLQVVTPANIQLLGKTYVGHHVTLTGDTITQPGLLHVGGDMFVNTNKYWINAKSGGALGIKNDGAVHTSQYHHLYFRKDHYQIDFTDQSIDTTTLWFSPAETLVKGKFIIRPLEANQADYQSADTDNRAEDAIDRLVVSNGRLYVGKSLGVDGNLTIDSTTYKINAKEILQAPNRIDINLTPYALINTPLWSSYHKNFKTMWEFLDYVFAEKHLVVGLYQFSRERLLDTLLQNNGMGATYRTVLTQIFNADLRAAPFAELKKRWQEFKESTGEYNVNVFAPKAEVFANENVVQKNGSLFVGANLYEPQETFSGREYREYNGLNLSVQDARSVTVGHKIRGVQSTQQYLNTLKDQLRRTRNNRVYLKNPGSLELTPADYAGIGELNPFNQLRNIGDDGALALLVLEQIKDAGGATLASGERLKTTFLELFDSTRKYQRALNSIRPLDNGKFEVVDGGEVKIFDSQGQANYYVENAYDHIAFYQDPKQNNWYVPEVVLSSKTKARLTNFNKVAASLTGVEAIRTINNYNIDVIHGALTAKFLQLETKGDINLKSTVGNFALTANNSVIDARNGNFNLTGNAIFGNVDLKAGDIKFAALPYITARGDLANQGIVKTGETSIAGDHVELDAVKVTASGDVAITATDIEMKSRYNEASHFESYSRGWDWTGRYLKQSGEFVSGAQIVAKNLDLDAQKDLKADSATLVASENLNVRAGGNVELTASKDVKYIEGYETKVFHTMGAAAQFGSAIAYVQTQSVYNSKENGMREEHSLMVHNQKANPTPAQAPLVEVSSGLGKETTIYKHTEITTHSNLLDAQNVVVMAGEKAEIGNTHLNVLNGGVTEDNKHVKNTTVVAKEITQSQNDNFRNIEIDNSGWQMGVSLTASSSVANLFSHMTSAIRAEEMQQQVNPNYAFGLIGDIIGIGTHDLIAADVRLGISGFRNWANIDEVHDNTNVLAGNLTLVATEGDVRLKANQAPNLGNVEIVAAKNVEILGSQSEAHKQINTNRWDVSIGASAGLSVVGPLGTATFSAGGSNTWGTEEAITYENSLLNANNIKVHAGKDVLVRSANLNAVDAVEITGENVGILTQNDTYRQEKTTLGSSVTLGSTISLKPVPFGQVGFAFAHHNEFRSAPSQLTGVSAGRRVDVKASKNLGLTSTILAAPDGKVEAEKVNNENLEVIEIIQGGSANLDLGVNRHKSAVIAIRGNIDASRYHNSVLRTTIADSIAINDAVKELSMENQPEVSVLNNPEVGKLINSLVETDLNHGAGSMVTSTVAAETAGNQKLDSAQAQKAADEKFAEEVAKRTHLASQSPTGTADAPTSDASAANAQGEVLEYDSEYDYTQYPDQENQASSAPSTSSSLASTATTVHFAAANPQHESIIADKALNMKEEDYQASSKLFNTYGSQLGALNMFSQPAALLNTGGRNPGTSAAERALTGYQFNSDGKVVPPVLTGDGLVDAEQAIFTVEKDDKINRDLNQIVDVRLNTNYQAVPLTFAISTTMPEDVLQAWHNIKNFKQNLKKIKVEDILTVGIESLPGYDGYEAASDDFTVTHDNYTSNRPFVYDANVAATADTVSGIQGGYHGITASATTATPTTSRPVNHTSTYNPPDYTASHSSSMSADIDTPSHVSTSHNAIRPKDPVLEGHETEINDLNNSASDLTNGVQGVVENLLANPTIDSRKEAYKAAIAYAFTNRGTTGKSAKPASLYNFSISNVYTNEQNQAKPVNNPAVSSFVEANKLFSAVEDANSNSLIYYHPITQQFGSVFRNRELMFALDPNNIDTGIYATDLASYSNTLTNPSVNNINTPALGGNAGNVPTLEGNGDMVVPTAPEAPGNYNPDSPFSNRPDIGVNFDAVFVPSDPPPVFNIPEVKVPTVDNTLPTTETKPTEVEVPTKPNRPYLPDLDDPDFGEFEGELPFTKPAIPEAEKPVVDIEKPVVTPEPTVKEDDATPADGNAEDGEEIYIGQERKVTKVVIQDLTCYVLQRDSDGSAHRAFNMHQAANDPTMTANYYESFLAKNGMAPQKQTLFSTYSNSIIDVLGDSGVICLKSGDNLLKTDFNEVTFNDVDGPEADRKRLAHLGPAPQDLDVLIVVERDAQRSKLVANQKKKVAPARRGSRVAFASARRPSAPAQATRVVEQPVAVEIVEIQRSLERRGIDASKLLILGSKNAAIATSPDVNTGSSRFSTFKNEE